MSSFSATVVILSLWLAVGGAAPDGDFGFDATDDFELELEGGMWGSREAFAFIGHTFHLIVPREAFDVNIKAFEAKRFGGKALPPWLLFDRISGTFWGVPLQEDAGPFQVIVKSLPRDKSSTYQLTIDVRENNSRPDGLQDCPKNEDDTILTLLVDKNIRAIKPKQRVIAINNIAKFFGLPHGAFTLKPEMTPDDITDSSVVLAGPGNLRTRASKLTTMLQVPVGCDGRLWESTASMVHQLKQQARDGTIAEVLRLPLIGWRVKTETRPALRNKRQTLDEEGSGDYVEEYYDDYEEYDSGDYGGDPDDKTTATTISSTTTTTMETPKPTHPHRHHHGESVKPNEVFPSIAVTRDRHNHEIPKPNVDEQTTTSTTSTTTERPLVTTTAETPIDLTTSNDRELPKSNYDYEYYDNEDDDEYDGYTDIPNQTERVSTRLEEEPTQPDEEPDIAIEPVSERGTTKGIGLETQPPLILFEEPTTANTVDEDLEPPIEEVTIAETTTTTTTEVPTTEAIISSTTATTTTTTTSTTTTTPIPTTISETTTSTTTSTTTTSTTTQEPSTTMFVPTTIEEQTIPEDTTTSVKVTTVRHVTEPPKSTTTIREITEETIEYESKNFKPYIENRLQQMSVFAGKIFRFVVPINTFKDFEDEYNLTLQFLDSNEQPIDKNSWCQFNPSRREIYGLPLEKDVSKWTYYVRATDREGGWEQDRLTIQVQQHKMARVVNHEFTLQIRIEKEQEFPHYIDWSLKTLRALGKIYNTNMSEITVRRINASGELVGFTWSNDSIPTNYCPRSDIHNLFKSLTANDRGDPSRELNLALAPELRVKKVLIEEIGVCEQPTNPATPPVNFSPILRNPVDHVNATVGELLIYKVKDDTFYDPEDVDPRTLNISLLTSQRQAIPPTNWLQFDNKNREFYGIPRKSGRTEYQLVCEDSGGLSVTDSLEVVVYAQPKVHYNVEFSMAVLTKHDVFANSATLQKKFVEKLMELFREPNSTNIHFAPFKAKYDSTIVTWYNKSLPTVRCPSSEIARLESVMISKNENSISQRVHAIMEPEFTVSTIKINLMGSCKIKLPPPPDVVPVDESTPQSGADEYLITFIVPVVIISIMLFVAAVAACVLYRSRKRSGKMNVEEDARQSYGNKGIPVIFQEELEEKPEAGTKAPVILKDEKPPLAPPEYSKSGSVKLNDDSEPYQPPPPFARAQDSGRQSRPKPTPTYRKPPPYVPP